MQELVATGANKVEQILEEKVLVLVGHTRHIIHDISGIVLNEELCATRLEVGIRRQRSGTLNETIVCRSGVGMCGCTGIVQRSKDTRRTTFFDEVAHDLVIEVFDGRPLDLFPNILLLFALQRQLDKDLLQLLIDIVNAELLKGVVLENLKAEDILCRLH